MQQKGHASSLEQHMGLPSEYKEHTTFIPKENENDLLDFTQTGKQPI